MATHGPQTAGFALLLALVGCVSELGSRSREVGKNTDATPASRPVVELAPYPGTSEFRRRLAQNGSITFRSYEGKAYRMDCDLEITFFPDGKSHVFLYGFNLEGYTGLYRIGESGMIVAEFKQFSDRPMAMRLAYDERSLLPRSADHHTRFIMGGDEGFWPLRPISGDHEREVVARVKADMPTPH